MANLIIKSSADNLVLQGSDASPAITVGATGTTTFAENATLSGTANVLGTINPTGTTFPAGHVVRTSYVAVYDQVSHISTTSDDPTATGLIVSTPATTGSNVNIIHLSTSGYIVQEQRSTIYLYVNKNGAGYSRLWGSGNTQQQFGPHTTTAHHVSFDHTWVDTTGLTAGTNIYQIYFETAGGTLYLVHSGNDYSLLVQEIQA